MEENFSGLEVADNESVCPSCHLVYLTAAGIDGRCRDCHDAVILLSHLVF